MNSLIVAIALFYITHNPAKLLDKPDQQIGIPTTQRFNLKDNDCIIVSWKKENKWVDLEVWVCDYRLYSSIGGIDTSVLYSCAWRHKK